MQDTIFPSREDLTIQSRKEKWAQLYSYQLSLSEQIMGVWIQRRTQFKHLVGGHFSIKNLSIGELAINMKWKFSFFSCHLPLQSTSQNACIWLWNFHDTIASSSDKTCELRKAICWREMVTTKSSAFYIVELFQFLEVRIKSSWKSKMTQCLCSCSELLTPCKNIKPR